MKTSLSMLLLGFGVLACQVTHAQNSWLQDGRPGNPLFKNSVGFTVGTQGIGAEVGVPLSSRFNLRLGTSLLPYEGDVVKKFNSSRDYTNDFKVDFMNLSGFIDWQPFPKAGAFFRKMALTAGGAYFYKAKGTATTMLTDSYFVGDLEFTPEEVGEIRSKVNWEGWAPYVGFGWQQVRVAGNFNLAFNFGTYYVGSPDVRMTATNWLAPNAPKNEPVLRRNLEDYKWLPKVEIKLNFNY